MAHIVSELLVCYYFLWRDKLCFKATLESALILHNLLKLNFYGNGNWQACIVLYVST
jgi:hypothetical protein